MTIFTYRFDDLLPNVMLYPMIYFMLPIQELINLMLLILTPSTILNFIVRCLDGIPECVIAQFHEAAEELIEEKGATSAVAAAVAYIAGAKNIVSRSLLSAHQVCHNTVYPEILAGIKFGGWAQNRFCKSIYKRI